MREMTRRGFLGTFAGLGALLRLPLSGGSASPQKVYGAWCALSDSDPLTPAVHAWLQEALHYRASLTARELRKQGAWSGPMYYRVIEQWGSDPLEQGPQRHSWTAHTLGWKTCAWYDKGARRADG